MNSLRLPAWMSGIGAKGNALAAPILIILLLAMMILPLPAFILDLFFSFNIALSVIVLLTALYTVRRSTSWPSRRSCWCRPCCACR
jgi:flagellar biosynthesis protein FlhA